MATVGRQGATGRLLLLVALAAVAALYYGFTASPILADLDGDNGIYLLTAHHFSPYSAPSVVAEHVFRTSQYPPLFPLALALLGGGESLLVAHLLTTTFLVLALVACYRWLRIAGLGPGLAAVGAALFAVLPGTYRNALFVHSENLYLLLSLLCLAALGRCQGAGRAGPALGAVLLAGAADLTRGAGIALVATVVVHLWTRRVPGRIPLTFLAVAPVIAWPLLGGQERESYFQSFLWSYLGLDPGDALAVVAGQVRGLAGAWLGLFGASGAGAVFAGALGIACLAGTAHRLAALRPDAVYAALYLGLVILWPYPAETERLLLAAVPVLLGHGLLVAARVPLAFGRAGIALAPALLAAATGIQLLPSLALTATRFFASPPPGLEEYRRHAGWYRPDRREAAGAVRFAAALTAGLRRADRLLPAGACVIAVKPSLVAYHARRTSVPPPPERLSDTAFRNALAARGCGYFFFMDVRTPTYGKAMYPVERVAAELEVLDFVADVDDRTGRMLALLAAHRPR